MSFRATRLQKSQSNLKLFPGWRTLLDPPQLSRVMSVVLLVINTVLPGEWMRALCTRFCGNEGDMLVHSVPLDKERQAIFARTCLRRVTLLKQRVAPQIFFMLVLFLFPVAYGKYLSRFVGMALGILWCACPVFRVVLVQGVSMSRRARFERAASVV